ncbi:hypothetical protein ACFQ0B_76175 [Nonomuraea thailandensis]
MASYNPNDPALQADPFAAYQWLRDEQPLYRNDKLGFWAISRHADVATAWRDNATFSSDHGPALEQWGPDAAQTMGFVALDPPLHTLRRRQISQGFTPPVSAAWNRASASSPGPTFTPCWSTARSTSSTSPPRSPSTSSPNSSASRPRTGPCCGG